MKSSSKRARSRRGGRILGPKSSPRKNKRARSRRGGRIVGPKSSPPKNTRTKTTTSCVDSAATHHHILLPPPDEAARPMQPNLVQAEQNLGYSFRNPALLSEALTHSSVSPDSSYERLEFVGDSVLSLAFTNYLYIANPGLGPGDLSSLRAANVSTEKLARAAIRHGLYRLVRRNAQELDHSVDDFARAVMRERDHESTGRMSYGGSTKGAPKLLADIVEAVAGAVYIDSGLNLEVVWQVFRRILAPIVTRENLDEQPVTSLYKHCQKQGLSVRFKSSRKGGRNIAKVFVDGELMGSGSSEERHIAKLNAARDAMHRLSSSEEESEDGAEDEKQEIWRQGRREQRNSADSFAARRVATTTEYRKFQR